MNSCVATAEPRPEVARTFRELCDPARAGLAASLERGLRPRPLDVSDAQHERAVRRVAAMHRACIEARRHADPVFLPGGEWKAYIDQRRGLYDAMLAGDLETASGALRGFWRNELGPIVKEYARFDQLERREEPFTSRFIERVSRNFLAWRRFVGGLPAELAMPNVGDAWGLEIEGTVVAPKACRFHALARQTSELLRSSEGATVVELGGGFGGFAWFLMNRRPDAAYINADLPETLALAAYYLLGALPDSRVTLFGEPGWEDALETPGVTLLPNFAITRAPTASADVFLNTFSLSEMPAPALERNLCEIQRVTRGYFLHHNVDRAGIVSRGSERTPASRFPIDPDRFALIAANADLFHGHDGDYREFLYRRLGD